MYQVGDNIVYPMHGAGMIKAIEEREFLGKKQEYYIIKMAIDNMKVMIPASKMLSSSIRHVTDLASIKKIINKFQQKETKELLPWKPLNKAREFVMSELKLVEGINENKMKRFLLRLNQETVSIS